MYVCDCVCKDGLCYYALPGHPVYHKYCWHAVQNIEEQFSFVQQLLNLVQNLGSPIKCKHV